MSNGPGDFAQDCSQVRIAFRRLATEPPSSALFIAGTNPRPRGDVFLRSKTRHIRANFCEDAGCCRLVNPYHALH